MFEATGGCDFGDRYGVIAGEVGGGVFDRDGYVVVVIAEV